MFKWSCLQLEIGRKEIYAATYGYISISMFAQS